ncbi:MAG: thiamine-phosphate kinase [Bacteroidota bacterium]
MFENANKLNPLSQLGEFGLIGELEKAFPTTQAGIVMGIGDDAAVFEKDTENYWLLSTDMLVEGIHFDLVYTPLKHLGYKAIVSNVSDIAAMNGIPKAVTVSLAMSSKYTIEATEALYEGIQLACQKYGLDLVGGDTSSSKHGMMLSVSIVGEVSKNDIVYRNRAALSDLVVLTGDLGGAYVGLQILEREKSVFMANSGIQPELEGYDYILERQLKPEARTDIKKLLLELGIKPTSMIDVSDGLSSELHHLAKRSGVGFTIYEEKLPIDQLTYDTARMLNLDPTICALHGGEDYELLFTIPVTDFEKVKGNPSMSVIGYCSEAANGINLITRGETAVVPIVAQGWNAFTLPQ